MMKIAVIGAGAIGGLVAGYLKLQGEDVSLTGHPAAVAAIKQEGLVISGVRGNFQLKLGVAERLSYAPELAILATKTQDIAEAVNTNLKYLKSATILTTQNGVRAETIAAEYLSEDRLVSSIVMFGATSLEPGKVVHNFEGAWIIGRLSGENDELVTRLSGRLNKIFPSLVSADLRGMKYLKVFVNANNCIPAILGKSMQEAFGDPQVSKLAIAVWKEGLEIVNAASIKLVSLPDFPLERLTKLTALPLSESAKIYSGIIAGLSKEPLYGSVLQSIKRGKPSEIDYLNGEFVALAEENNLSAPLNAKLVEMVHRVETEREYFSKEQLIAETQTHII
jgi:2-dehydropantoate 2-reductase